MEKEYEVCRFGMGNGKWETSNFALLEGSNYVMLGCLPRR